VAHPAGEPIRIFLVTEHPALRQSLEMLLVMEGMVVCRLASDTATALRDLPSDADVVIVGLSGGGEGGLALLREMGLRTGHPPCLVLSANDDAQSVRRALAAGARGYVTNRAAPASLAHAVREVAAGRFCVAKDTVLEGKNPRMSYPDTGGKPGSETKPL